MHRLHTRINHNLKYQQFLFRCFTSTAFKSTWRLRSKDWKQKRDPASFLPTFTSCWTRTGSTRKMELPISTGSPPSRGPRPSWSLLRRGGSTRKTRSQNTSRGKTRTDKIEETLIVIQFNKWYKIESVQFICLEKDCSCYFKAKMSFS